MASHGSASVLASQGKRKLKKTDFYNSAPFSSKLADQMERKIEVAAAFSHFPRE